MLQNVWTLERAADPRELQSLPQPHSLWVWWEARLGVQQRVDRRSSQPDREPGTLWGAGRRPVWRQKMSRSTLGVHCRGQQPPPSQRSLRDCLAGHSWRNLFLSSSTISSGATSLTSGSGKRETRTKGTGVSHSLPSVGLIFRQEVHAWPSGGSLQWRISLPGCGQLQVLSPHLPTLLPAFSQALPSTAPEPAQVEKPNT